MRAFYLRFCVLLFLCIGAGKAFAAGESADSGALSLRGFGTLGVARSSSDGAEFVRDLSQTKGIKAGKWSGRIDSILGFQANWQAGREVELVGQVVSRSHYDKSRDPEVMWAFAKWDPDPRVSLRAGRIGADFMLLADSRLVGYSYLPVRPSPDFFGPLFFSHFDGLDGSVTLPLGNGLMRGKLFAGKTQEKAAGAPGVWDTSGSPVHGLVLDYLTGPWQFRFNAANIRFGEEIKTFNLRENLTEAGAFFPQALDAAGTLVAKNKWARFLSFGVVYDEGPLQVQAMLNRIRQETDIFEDSHAGYVMAGYRVGAVTPFAGVSRWVSSGGPYSAGLPNVGPLGDLSAGYTQFMAASRSYQTTYSLGARWDFRENMALKLQWDAIRGNSSSRFPFATTTPEWNGRTNVLTAVMDFVF